MSTNFEEQRHSHQRKQLEAEILHLYPSIPNEDLQSVLDHTLEDGYQRVGTNTNVSLSDRASRAVRAHVRHNHTLYDEFLAGYLAYDEPEDARENARFAVERRIRTTLRVWSKPKKQRKNLRR